MFGYNGRLLRVDLTKHKISLEELKERYLRKFFGGFGAKILFDELKPKIDPLGTENKIIFATGPLTGAHFTGGAKFSVVAKSPLTGIYGEANSSGFFGPELKFAGYDGIVFEGKAEQPAYLFIRNDEVQLRDASHLWGKDTGKTQKTISEEVGDEKTRVACIGPGGENLVRFACIINDMQEAAGRCGMGAVMGSKKLKAVAVRGTGMLKLKDKERFNHLVKRAGQEAMEGWGKDLNAFGTSGSVDNLNYSGRLPTKNFRQGTFEGAEKITGETMKDTIGVGQGTCFACRIACKRKVKAEEPYVVDPEYGAPEYESMAALGSLCMNDNLVSIAKANELCNKYGIDTISTGNVIAFSMECYEKGLVTTSDTEGIKLTWGSYQTIIELVEKISMREGFGNLLAEGVRRAAEKIGKESQQFAMHVKGLEIAMHEPRGKKGLGLSYATANRGGCHNASPPDDVWGEGDLEGKLAPEIGLDSTIARHRLYMGPEKAKEVVIGQNWWEVIKRLGACSFTIYPAGISIDTLIDIISSVTGWEVTPKELISVGERVWNLCRAFNVREGIGRKDDILPKRFAEPLPNGLYKGEAIPKDAFENLVDNYYEYRGWDKKTGIPTREKLEELGLKEVVIELYK